MSEKSKNKTSRRKVIASSLGMISLGVVPSITAAQPSINEVDEKGRYVVENGELKFVKLGSDEGAEIDDPVSTKAVESLNELNDDGYINYSEEDSTIQVELTRKAESKFGSESKDIGVFHHGVNDFDVKSASFTRPYDRYDFFIDNDVSREVVNILTVGAGASAALSAILAVTGAGAVPAAVSAILSAFLATAAGLIGNNNEGHGVRISVYNVPTSISPEFAWVHPQ